MLKRYIKWGESQLEKLSKYNYHLARFYYHNKLRRADKRFTELPLLVYQMGKVGSKSVTNSLGRASINRRIYHVHFLDLELVREYESKRRQYLRTEREGALRHVWQYSYLRKLISKGSNGRRWKIITLVRDPVARNLATFFENIEVVSVDSNQVWHLNSAEYGFKLSVKKDDLSALTELFFEKCRHDTPLVYYDREIKQVFNVDVYSNDFPTSLGYKVYRGKDADVLLIRLEDLNRCASDAFKALLEIDDLKLVNTNIGEQKDYADLYKDFKSYIRLPSSYLDRLYSSKLSKHFYDEKEITRFRERWINKA
jgi:hypothetical protein